MASDASSDSPVEYPFSRPSKLCELIDCSNSFLYSRRISGDWQEGIHWVYLNSENPRSGIRYNTKLCLNWMACRNTHYHQQAITHYLKSICPE